MYVEQKGAIFFTSQCSCKYWILLSFIVILFNKECSSSNKTLSM